jgi:hypothetical protein
MRPLEQSNIAKIVAKKSMASKFFDKQLMR